MNTDHYIIGIQQKKRGNMDIYNELITEKYGRCLSWDEVKELPLEDLRKLMMGLKNRIKIKNSKIDIKKLGKAIQYARSGVGGASITPYTCKFCGKEDSWGNTAVPNICGDCSENMAKRIVLNEMDIFKEI